MYLNVVWRFIAHNSLFRAMILLKLVQFTKKKVFFLALFYICWLVLDINPSFCHSHSFQVWKNQSVNKQNLISVYVTNSCELCISLITRRLTFKLLKNTRHALFNHFRYWKRGKKINQNCDHVPLNRALLERGGIMFYTIFALI